MKKTDTFSLFSSEKLSETLGLFSTLHNIISEHKKNLFHVSFNNIKD